jgi:hypothetical protein
MMLAEALPRTRAEVVDGSKARRAESPAHALVPESQGERPILSKHCRKHDEIRARDRRGAGVTLGRW